MARIRCPAVLLLTAAGCSGAATSEAFIEQYCDVIAPCCGQMGLPTDGKQCRAVFTAFAGISGTYDPSAGDACLRMARGMGSALCTTHALSGCSQVYRTATTGTKMPGQTCSADGDCIVSTEGIASCTTAFNAMGAETKTCQIQIVGQAGDSPCFETIDGETLDLVLSSTGAPPSQAYSCDKASGLYCDSNHHQCTRIATMGDPCSSDSACASGTFCDSTGKCSSHLALGAMCDGSQQCGAGSYCPQTSKMCTASIADGAPCTTGEACASQLCVNGACSRGSGGDFEFALVCGKSS
jgi:hypothetical protein